MYKEMFEELIALSYELSPEELEVVSGEVLSGLVKLSGLSAAGNLVDDAGVSLSETANFLGNVTPEGLAVGSTLGILGGVAAGGAAVGRYHGLRNSVRRKLNSVVESKLGFNMLDNGNMERFSGYGYTGLAKSAFDPLNGDGLDPGFEMRGGPGKEIDPGFEMRGGPGKEIDPGFELPSGNSDLLRNTIDYKMNNAKAQGDFMESQPGAALGLGLGLLGYGMAKGKYLMGSKSGLLTGALGVTEEALAIRKFRAGRRAKRDAAAALSPRPSEVTAYSYDPMMEILSAVDRQVDSFVKQAEDDGAGWGTILGGGALLGAGAAAAVGAKKGLLEGKKIWHSGRATSNRTNAALNNVAADAHTLKYNSLVAGQNAGLGNVPGIGGTVPGSMGAGGPFGVGGGIPVHDGKTIWNSSKSPEHKLTKLDNGHLVDYAELKKRQQAVKTPTGRSQTSVDGIDVDPLQRAKDIGDLSKADWIRKNKNNLLAGGAAAGIIGAQALSNKNKDSELQGAYGVGRR